MKKEVIETKSTNAHVIQLLYMKDAGASPQSSSIGRVTLEMVERVDIRQEAGLESFPHFPNRISKDIYCYILRGNLFRVSGDG